MTPGAEPQDDRGPQSPARPAGSGPESPHSSSHYGGPIPPGGWARSPGSPPPPVPAGPLASWGRRLAAYVIDLLIVGIPTAALLALFGAGAIGIGDDGGDAMRWGGSVRCCSRSAGWRSRPSWRCSTRP